MIKNAVCWLDLLGLVSVSHTLDGEALVPEELGAHSLGGHLAVLGGLGDAVLMGLLVLVVVGVILRLGHRKRAN